MRKLEIKYSKQALKFLKKQDVVTQKRIINAISNLPKGDVKKLQNRNGRRLRIGDYRVIFDNVENERSPTHGKNAQVWGIFCI